MAKRSMVPEATQTGQFLLKMNDQLTPQHENKAVGYDDTVGSFCKYDTSWKVAECCPPCSLGRKTPHGLATLFGGGEKALNISMTYHEPSVNTNHTVLAAEA